MIYVVATLRMHPGKLAALTEAAKKMIAETLKEKGCVSYDLHQSVTDPDKLVFVERWETREHLAAHFQTPHMAAWRAEGGPMIAERKVEIIEPANVEVR